MVSNARVGAVLREVTRKIKQLEVEGGDGPQCCITSDALSSM